jgi:TolB protein
LSTGQRRIVAGLFRREHERGGLAGRREGGDDFGQGGQSVNVYVCNADGTGLKRLTTSEEDSSPCWSPDGQWICFATKISERRVLAKVPAGGGAVQRISTAGVSNPTEPDWSPDGKWIAFTSQMGEFQHLRHAGGRQRAANGAGGGRRPVVVAEFADADFCTRRTGIGHYMCCLCLTCSRNKSRILAQISGNDSEPAWAK